MAGVSRSLLSIRDLCIHFHTPLGNVRAVEDFNLDIDKGQRWALLGESGSGKTVMAQSILRLLPATAEISGQVCLGGKDMLALSPRQLRRVRGGEAAMIFEQPGSCLDPLFTVGSQVAEAIMAHKAVGRKEAIKMAVDLLHQVRIPSPKRFIRHYPHELSGGMRQKVMIAIALAVKPELIIADEPTTALDATVQIHIIDLLDEVLQESGSSLLLITHDSDVARALCAHTAIMYAGHIVETGPLVDVFQTPRHPYTQALLGALGGERPVPIAGQTPSLTDLPPGCRFHPRCPHAHPRCRVEVPVFVDGLRCLR